MQGGLTHFPSGDATLRVNRRGRLVIGNLGPSGRDGVSTQIPGWTSLMVEEPTPVRSRRQELLTR